VAHSEELEALQKLLHFPEEVALRLADTEYHLFYQVPPIDYLRQVTLDLGSGTGDVPTTAPGPGPSATESATSASASTARPSVRCLIKRFNEVESDAYIYIYSYIIYTFQCSVDSSRNLYALLMINS
jgi:phosphatidylinositol phospholipase C epsilon